MAGQPAAPGRVLRFLLKRNLSPSQIDLLLGELNELYEHRASESGPTAADRWLRREHRRWCFQLLRGVVGEELAVSDVVHGPRPRGLGLTQDLRHNLRGLRRAPLLALALITTVGLGIGGTTLVYSVVHSVLISPLPYPGADRLVLLRTINQGEMWGTSMADLEALYEPPPAFETIAGYSYGMPAIAIGDGVEVIRSKWVTDNYFSLIGVEPIVGRGFTDGEGGGQIDLRTGSAEGGSTAVMITEAFAERAFGSNQTALESALTIDGLPHPVVGVLPDQLGPLDDIDVFPALQVLTPSRKGPFFYTIIGRLRDGVDPAVAREQLDAVAQRIFPIWQDSFTLETATIGFVDLKEMMVGNVARTLVLVLAAVGLLLLIASANAASLLVARGVAREREVSIRAALGASRGRIFQLLISEAGLLALGGALLGLAITWFGIGAVQSAGIDYLPRAQEIALNAPTFGFLLAVTLGSGALFGLIATGASLGRGASAVGGPTRGSTASRGMRRLRRGLVASQFAISIPLLVGAGLLAVSLDRLRSEDLGFDPDRLVSMQVALPGTSYGDEQAVREFWADVMPQVEALPGVVAAGLADARPPVETGGANNFVLAGRPDLADQNLQAPWITADKGYFDAVGIRTVEGRIFNDPMSDSMRTAVVDEAWSERYFPGRSPLGERFMSGGCTVDGCAFVEVVGVVTNVKTTGLDDDHSRGTIYYHHARDSYSTMYLHVRARGNPADVVPAIRELVARRDPSVPVADFRSAQEIASESLAGRTYTSLLVLLLATVALLLSVVGVYGAMSYYVRQHSRETGIRIALGERPSAALQRVVRQGMGVAVLGTFVGLLAALVLTRYMSSLLYDVSVTDPLILGGVCATALVVALAATAIPGRVAAATDPASTLRED
ncbi:MAG: ADOP family duplicated permease [Longimicrobiales bacterium]